MRARVLTSLVNNMRIASIVGWWCLYYWFLGLGFNALTATNGPDAHIAY